MKTTGLLFATLLPLASALAGPNAYQCEIQDHLLLDDSGKFMRPPKQYLLGQRFAVDRASGRLTGPESSFHFADSDFRVLARGNESNAFVSTISTRAAKGGMHFAVVRVEEFSQGKLKPFTVADGGTIASGICD